MLNLTWFFFVLAMFGTVQRKIQRDTHTREVKGSIVDVLIGFQIKEEFRIVFSLTSLAVVLRSVCRKFVLPSVSGAAAKSSPTGGVTRHMMNDLASEKFSRRQADLSHDVARLSPRRVCIGSPKAFFGVARRDWEYSCWS